MRMRSQTVKIILATSLLWFLVDVAIIMYYTDCGRSGCRGRDDSKGPSADPLVHSDDNPVNGLHHAAALVSSREISDKAVS